MKTKKDDKEEDALGQAFLVTLIPQSDLLLACHVRNIKFPRPRCSVQGIFI